MQQQQLRFHVQTRTGLCLVAYRIGLPDDGNEIALLYRQADIFQNMNAVRAAAEVAVDVFTFD